MAAPLALLFFLGLWLDPNKDVEAATYVETTPRLWIEPESPSSPWSNASLQCAATNTAALSFQLWKDGELFRTLPPGGPMAAFRLGPVTAHNRGIYRCRVELAEKRWSSVSAPVEATGEEPLPAPSLRADPGPWILHGLDTQLHCQGALLGMTFDLYRDGELVSSSHTPPGAEATFVIREAGNYSCLYRAPGTKSAPSQTIHAAIPDSLPKPSFSSGDNRVIRPGDSVTFHCGGRFSRLEFKLFKDGQQVFVPRLSSSDPQRIRFHLMDLRPEDGGTYSCRYRFKDGPPIWSEDSEPLELVLSTETLAKPSLSVEPRGPAIPRGTNVTMRCRGSQPNVRFVLLKKGSPGPVSVLSSAEPHVDFVLPDILSYDTGNFSCLYLQAVAPLAGSQRSEDVEIRVDGLLPKPTLHPMHPIVAPGRDAVLRCSGEIPNSHFQLFRDGENEELEVWALPINDRAADFLLKNSNRQDGGKYRCRYATRVAPILVSEMSDPAELQVTGHGSFPDGGGLAAGSGTP
ncbi:venom metalloproteinase inhibitor DM43-like [Monodelphis domestica]|uniref:venom metalloproteinase inhibitor DM43-like n=1 Tax=Monodelphis domestica TaxID=13616 RepID=UPI0024E1C251|nr:venom metalloproteinase inhibitor DM43-like [Monodelphis domestica]